MWQTYILKCADGTLYVGSTNDLKRRILEHNQGKGAKYTRSRRPVTLVYCEESISQSAAFKREAEIKKWSRAKKLEFLRCSPDNPHSGFFSGLSQ
ncbi:MAG: GIY-YIG nuclease family protein [Candidatus Omnitrophota bacterium]